MQIKTILTILVIVTALGFVAAHSYVPQALGSKSCGDDPFVKRINGGGHTFVHCVEEHK
jgi:hypothetical protein